MRLRLDSRTSHDANVASNASSLLGVLRAGYFGSTISLASYLRMVLRDSPIRRAISRIGIPSRRCQRLITLNNATSITPFLLPGFQQDRVLYVGQYSMQIPSSGGSVLSANQHAVINVVGGHRRRRYGQCHRWGRVCILVRDNDVFIGLPLLIAGPLTVPLVSLTVLPVQRIIQASALCLPPSPHGRRTNSD